MKKEVDIIIAVLGWEERFLLGFKKNLINITFKKFILINFNVKPEATANYKEEVQQLCKEHSIEFIEMNLNYFDSINSWKKISVSIPNLILNSHILLDISTIPRETIWTLIHLGRQQAKKIDFIYHKPKSYSLDWLTKEPGKPRLLLKHSGIQKLNIPTALIIITGFEMERARQLVYYFEPKLTILGIQRGTQFENKIRNKESHKYLSEISDIQEFETDGYASDFGYNVLDSTIEKVKNNYNLVVASLGPKTTSIAIYKAFLKNPEIALAYVPNKDFNIKYSEGIGDEILGSI